MKQPDLGKKISELRKEKGLTQEELVELCNINVRTIQRIESGEVTPRSYTLKTILKALDYNLEEIHLEESSRINFTNSDFKIISFAFWIGILFSIVDFFNVFLNISLEFDLDVLGDYFSFNATYIVTQVASIVLAICFYFGFYKTATILKNDLLKVTSILMIIVSIANYFISILVLDSDDGTSLAFGVISAICYGAVGIPYGIAIFKLNTYVGTYATITGIFIIIFSACLLTVILSFLSIFLFVPVMVLELILLYKIKERLQHQ